MQFISQSFVPAPDQVFGKPNLLILAEGLDYDYTANDIEFSTNSRSDIIKAINLDFANRGAYVVSVPRDMLARFPTARKQKSTRPSRTADRNSRKKSSRTSLAFRDSTGTSSFASMQQKI